MNPENLIKAINTGCRNLCREQVIMERYQHHIYRVRGRYDALNRFDFPEESVKVIHWFSDFWLFLEVKFIVEDKKRISETHTCISVSIFQGKAEEEKQQLFRAEWDDYHNPDEKHPQPHWHITSSQAIEKTLREYADNFVASDFISLLEQEKGEFIDVKRIHFAMNGNWHKDGNHTHKMENEQQVVKWLQGLLKHLRTELET